MKETMGSGFFQPLCLHELIEAQAARTPGAVAVADTHGNRRLTYGQLDERAGRLARHLRALGVVGPETRVGICLERSPELVVAALGVLKAGGAYLPLDPAHPAERLAYVLADSAVPVLITSRALQGALSAGSARIVEIDGDAGEDNREGDGGELPPVRVLPENLAYVIYTSGSTGRPKGTGLTHAGLPNLIAWHQQEYPQGYGLAPADRATMLASPAFDASVAEIWPVLATGASLHVPPREVVSSPADLLAWLAAERITVCFLPTPLAEACLELPLASPPDLSLRAVLAAGDRLHKVARALPFRLFNLYGPTEATVMATGGVVETGPESEAAPPIGRPAAGFRVYLLGPDLQPVPAGEPGEIALAGAGLARGYLGRPELTAERFVPDPWAETPGGRLYLTGDLGRLRPSGDLDFVGRVDHQVKIRGFRVELGEVEAALRGCPGIREAVAAAVQGPAGAPLLAAYVVGSSSPDELRRRLEAFLPEAMVPAVFVFLETLPLSPNGKVDRKALPAPELVTEREPTAPRTATEEVLAAIWREVLGVERVGAGDHFLELGGHSLTAAQILARVRERLRVELAARDVFDHPVLRDLAARIEELAGSAAPASPVVPVPRGGDLPLSYAQERVWFLQRLDPSIRSYQAQAMIRFRGRLNVEALRRGLDGIVERHEIFRTTFPTVGDGPVQRFHPAWDVPLPVVDLSGLPAGTREAEAARAIDAGCRRPFDVERLPLVRWTLLRLAPEEHVWLHAEHHLVHDGWSFNRVLEELMALYAAFSRGEPSPLTPLPLQFADWAVWQREWMRGPEAAAQIDWWKRTLSGRPAVLELPTDRPRPRRQSFAGRVERVELPASLCAALRAASRREGVSLYVLMQAAFAALLSRYSGQDQVNVGSAVANRRWRETEPIVGMMVDNVVLANDLSGEPSVRELLRRSWRLALETAARQDIPFDLVVEAVQPERDLAYNPLFQASFSFHDSPFPGLAFPGLEAKLTEGIANGSAKFDLNAIGIPRDERITLLWESASALFDRSTALRMMGHFQTLLAGFAAEPGSRAAELPVLTQEERCQLVEWSGAEIDLPRGVPVHELFEAWSERTPEAPAVGGMTYGELEALANRIAWRLRRLGVGPEVRVGVCLERSPGLMAAVLGVLKAGGAYLPLDPGHPAERLAYILEDAAVAVLIADRTGNAVADSVPVLSLGGDLEGESAECPRPRVPVQPENLAYVIYTSGSTGRPKGTELTHAGLLNLIGWHLREYGLTAADRATLVASPAFDASVWETWPALASGASLHVPPEAIRSSPPDLLAWLASERITACFLPTPLAEACLGLEPPAELALRVLLTGGDRLHPVPRPLPFRLVNHYGPTESTVVSTAGDVEDGEAVPPIGRPIANLRAWVLDGRLRRVPAGVPGQLHVGGAGLARGYLRRPELTAEKFIPNPFEEPGSRIYRTGDLVRWLPDGRIDFLGRTDHQVKIRGVRIELGEIEALLGQHPAVRTAAVIAREGPGGPRLLGYAVADSMGKISGEELRAFLAARLPGPMVPSEILILDALPLTPNGKVDLAALPEPAPAQQEEGEPWAAPRTPVEELLQEIWSELTGVERVGIRDDFFKLGGHSLLGARMLSRLRDELDVHLPLSAVFERPTIEGLAAAVEDFFLAEAGETS
ncbi:MAG TPA: amino acid adenylation domain-containing protein [Thermoanaerobaculia bacterium]|jgi:amino acid adenylation domain-containing protein|nr:amino acid adenylation domain-containing protein [Thermoanaerobaculia bacterium]